MASMNDIPIEILPYILRHLKLSEIIQCRLISKRFKDSLRLIKIRQLIIHQDADQKLKFHWSHSVSGSLDEVFSTELSVNWIAFLKISSLFDMDQSLKCLEIDRWSRDFMVDALNTFEQLEQLKIDDLANGGQIKLDLNHLHTLNIVRRSPIGKYILNTPKLETIRVLNLDRIDICYPDQIKNLKIHKYCPELARFKNLESLGIKFTSDLPQNILEIHSNLKSLRVFISHHSSDQQEPVFYESLSYILKQKLVKRRLDFHLYCYDIEIRNNSKLDELRSIDTKDIFRFQMDNYDLLDINSTMCCVDYSIMIDNIPNCFFKRFIWIQRVTVKIRLDDQNRFVDFLKKLNLLKQLILERTYLDQQFFNDISNITKCKLTYLRIIEDNRIDLSSLIEMKQLNKLYTNQLIPVYLIENFKQLVSFDFYTQIGTRIHINKMDNHLHRYHVALNYFQCNLIDFDALVYWCKNYKIKKEIIRID